MGRGKGNVQTSLVGRGRGGCGTLTTSVNMPPAKMLSKKIPMLGTKYPLLGNKGFFLASFFYPSVYREA